MKEAAARERKILVQGMCDKFQDKIFYTVNKIFIYYLLGQKYDTLFHLNGEFYFPI